ncbi:DEAD/DEAH box helicase [Quadrisphaera sp. DSM 44207]|uniref:DEAD/DEAH box helicase n=1 Tax=Quadrisphaera sp. DSM 44207 TaxID=1881057 RepID=UPI000880C1F2|nr:DEAD/DEAH box helicase [Quadrisphaera sp. DSM 44207]SDQ42785.1 ATP-dependent RNA helicase DeaD [Quadrisphaera sp. DSM 44207]
MSAPAVPDPSTPASAAGAAAGAATGAAAGRFADLGLRPELLEALAGLGYEEPTPIQTEAVPVLLTGRDVVGQAATGTGKTAAFALPLLQRITEGGPQRAEEGAPSALVLVPTRELAIQVAEAVQRYGQRLRVRVLAVYGGQAITSQLRALRAGVDVVVATPGRALDHLRRGSLRLDAVRVVVLDEADEMLDMGFAEDIEAILQATPEQRQTLLFSATMPPRIDGIARQHLRDPVQLRVAREAPAAGEAPLVRQSAYVVARPHRAAALGRVLDVEAPAAAIVFCRSRGEVDELAEVLGARGHRAEALHGGMSQEQRDRVMGRLRSRTADLLVATDVAARGLDVEHLTHVVNYGVPAAPESYVHRIGRVGRGGREGVAITLAEPRERRALAAIERATGQRIPVHRVPSVEDLRAARLRRTRAALVEAVRTDGASAGARAGLGPYRELAASVAEAEGRDGSLHGSLDAVEREALLDVAAAALALAAAGGGSPEDDVEIPEATQRGAAPALGARPPRAGTPHRAASERAGGARPRVAGRGRGRSDSTTRLFIGLGRAAGIRPQDLVGAIANESPVSGREIGAVEIADRFSLVEVPESTADEVVRALRGSIIRGRRATVRRERYEAR